MTDLDHRHIAYLERLNNVAEKFKYISATKKKYVLDMVEHGLLVIENDYILVKGKSQELIAHIEAETKNFLNSPHHG